MITGRVSGSDSALLLIGVYTYLVVYGCGVIAFISHRRAGWLKGLCCHPDLMYSKVHAGRVEDGDEDEIPVTAKT